MTFTDIVAVKGKHFLDYIETAALIGSAAWALFLWRRAKKWEGGKLAWDLTDKIHEQEDAVVALEIIDHETDSIVIDEKSHTIRRDKLVDDVKDALHFEKGPYRAGHDEFPCKTPLCRAIRAKVDALLYGSRVAIARSAAAKPASWTSRIPVARSEATIRPCQPKRRPAGWTRNRHGPSVDDAASRRPRGAVG